MEQPQTPWWAPHLARAASMALGASVFVHDVFFTSLDRPWTLGLASILLGVPSTLYFDKMRRLNKLLSDDSTPPTAHSRGDSS